MKKTGIALVIALAPAFALAANNVDVSYFTDILGKLKNILDTVAPIIIGIAFVWFLWGVFRFVVSADSEGKDKAKDTIIYGIIGLVVMLSVWGIVRFVQNVVGIQGESAPTLPQVPR